VFGIFDFGFNFFSNWGFPSPNFVLKKTSDKAKFRGGGNQLPVPLCHDTTGCVWTAELVIVCVYVSGSAGCSDLSVTPPHVLPVPRQCPCRRVRRRTHLRSASARNAPGRLQIY